MSDELDRPWKRLKAARRAAGYLTAKEFSDTHGISQVTYNSHERPPRKEGGKGRAFSPPTAERYAELLKSALPDITGDWLLHNVGDPPAKIVSPSASKTPPHAQPDNQAARRRGSPPAPALPDIDPDVMAAAVTAAETLFTEEGKNPGREIRAEIYFALHDAMLSAGPDGMADLDHLRPLIRVAARDGNDPLHPMR